MLCYFSSLERTSSSALKVTRVALGCLVIFKVLSRYRPGDEPKIIQFFLSQR